MPMHESEPSVNGKAGEQSSSRTAIFLAGTVILAVVFSIVWMQSAKYDLLAVGKQAPDFVLTDLNDKPQQLSDFRGKVVFLNFWATWCAPCKKELNAINDLYSDWQAETGVTLVAVSIDDEKTKSQVAIYVDGKAWEYIVLLDPNGDFKRAMGVNNVPHTFLVDTDGTIVYSHNNYAPGDEEKLYEEIKKLSLK